MGDELRASRPRRPPTRLVTDIVVVLASCAVVIGLSGSRLVGGALPQPLTGQVLTLVAATAAAGAAILGALVSRVLDDPRPRWIAAALALYAVVVLPSTALATSIDDGARLVAYLVTTGMLAASIRPPAELGAAGTWSIAAVGAVLAVLAFGAPAVAPDLVRPVISGPIAVVAVLIGWTAVAAAVVIEGYRLRSTPRWRVGLGLVVVAAAQLYRVLTDHVGDLVFGGFRLLGLVVVVAGLGQWVARTLADVNSVQLQQQEELCSAALHMERAAELAAERSHELRNGLAGLAGITHLLSSQTGGADHRRLKVAVLAELSRLHDIVDGNAVHDSDLDGHDLDDPPAQSYQVGPVIAGLAVLRRSRGEHVDLDVDPALEAWGDSVVLAQVVTNLLANCSRHAPGTRVTIHAYRRGQDAVVEVRDEGPGLRPGTERSVLARGVRDETAGGTGLGLGISNRLVGLQGGTLTLRTVDAPHGCLVTVVVPAVGEGLVDAIRPNGTRRPPDSPGSW